VRLSFQIASSITFGTSLWLIGVRPTLQISLIPNFILAAVGDRKSRRFTKHRSRQNPVSCISRIPVDAIARVAPRSRNPTSAANANEIRDEIARLSHRKGCKPRSTRKRTNRRASLARASLASLCLQRKKKKKEKKKPHRRRDIFSFFSPRSDASRRAGSNHARYGIQL